LLHIPNADHPLSFLPANESKGVATFAGSLLAFFRAVATNKPRPRFTWEISEDGHSITVANFSVPPKHVSMWAATTIDGYRDFRLYNCRTGAGKNCTSDTQGAAGGPAAHVVKYLQSPATPLAKGVWEAKVPPPPAGQWTSFLVDVKFGLLEGGFHFTTQMSIVPVARPFKPCVGDGCQRLV
jgi:hypothetical protein